jgi:hypothetical protein
MEAATLVRWEVIMATVGMVTVETATNANSYLLSGLGQNAKYSARAIMSASPHDRTS